VGFLIWVFGGLPADGHRARKHEQQDASGPPEYVNPVEFVGVELDNHRIVCQVKNVDILIISF